MVHLHAHLAPVELIAALLVLLVVPVYVAWELTEQHLMDVFHVLLIPQEGPQPLELQHPLPLLMQFVPVLQAITCQVLVTLAIPAKQAPAQVRGRLIVLTV